MPDKFDQELNNLPKDLKVLKLISESYNKKILKNNLLELETSIFVIVKNKIPQILTNLIYKIRIVILKKESIKKYIKICTNKMKYLPNSMKNITFPFVNIKNLPNKINYIYVALLNNFSNCILKKPIYVKKCVFIN